MIPALVSTNFPGGLKHSLRTTEIYRIGALVQI